LPVGKTGQHGLEQHFECDPAGEDDGVRCSGHGAAKDHKSLRAGAGIFIC